MSNEVKSAKRVFEILRFFAATRAPSGLSQIAAALNYPKSSCLALLETLEAEGYAYQVAGGYYLTRRWLNEASTVAEHDYLVLGIRPRLNRLRNELGETVILARLSAERVVYLDVAEADRVLRFSAQAGQLKPLHASASGRALLSVLPPQQQAELIGRLTFEPLTPHTATDAQRLRETMQAGAARGWHVNIGEYQADTLSVAAAVSLHGSPLALVVGAPISRALDQVDTIGAALAQAAGEIASKY